MKKSLVFLTLLCGAFVHARPAEVPVFEFWNKTERVVSITITNEGYLVNSSIAVAPGEWYGTWLDVSSPTTLQVKPVAIGPVQSYTFTIGKNIFVRLKEENGKYILGPQTGPLMGFTGSTERGYSKKNMVTESDIFQK